MNFQMRKIPSSKPAYTVFLESIAIELTVDFPCKVARVPMKRKINELI